VLIHAEASVPAFTVGKAFTTIAWVIVAVQPPVADVPVTVYVIFAVGLTVIAAVVALLLQVYVLAPEAVRVVVPPIQIEVADGVITNVGAVQLDE